MQQRPRHRPFPGLDALATARPEADPFRVLLPAGGLGRIAPQLAAGCIVADDAALGVGDGDAHRQRVQHGRQSALLAPSAASVRRRAVTSTRMPAARTGRPSASLSIRPVSRQPAAIARDCGGRAEFDLERHAVRERARPARADAGAVVRVDRLDPVRGGEDRAADPEQGDCFRRPLAPSRAEVQLPGAPAGGFHGEPEARFARPEGAGALFHHPRKRLPSAQQAEGRGEPDASQQPSNKALHRELSPGQ